MNETLGFGREQDAAEMQSGWEPDIAIQSGGESVNVALVLETGRIGKDTV